MNHTTCKACHGSGMQRDDEGWQYKCSVCHGEGVVNESKATRSVKIMSTDENNRLLD